MRAFDRRLIDRPRLRVTVSHRQPSAYMGRFGGGWQWQLGVQAGSRWWRDVIVSLLVLTVRVRIGARS